ncbi:hypothetical protein BN1723_019190, partial [Verticillium longisporum]
GEARARQRQRCPGALGAAGRRPRGRHQDPEAGDCEPDRLGPVGVQDGLVDLQQVVRPAPVQPRALHHRAARARDGFRE